ncbi:MAG: DNA-deoxyinosine glycosylase [Spirochaetaceae bacterium]|nr:DNA-deoxyinosine glycosylase [Spirochaetaceae bacterium]
MDRMLAGFDPVVDDRTRILVVGSMPGTESIRRGEYYAHPRNRFWRMVEAVLGIPSSLPYDDRLRCLNDSGIGLWDVLSSCERRGSMDAYIRRRSEIYNDFASLLRMRRGIRAICCNGVKAYDSFSRHIMPSIEASIAERLSIVRLPSTSPANAAYLYEDIVMSWGRAFHDT